jgi:hypothetical protein
MIQNLSAQSAESILKTRWKGKSISRNYKIDGGYLICDLLLFDIDFYGDESFSGTSMMSFTLDGKKYSCTASVSGKIDFATHGVTLTHTRKYLYTDQLPDGLSWPSNVDHLTLYKDDDHPGYYIMNGYSPGMLTSSGEGVIYSNYPSW